MGGRAVIETEKAALISPDELYRYWLSRLWDAKLPALVVAGLNPSTADGKKDDPTIRKCIGFAQRWGYGSLLMVNLFAYRATDPKAMMRVAEPVGPDNDQWLTSSVGGRTVLCAWGKNGAHLNRAAAVYKLIAPVAGALYCLGTTNEGQPRHPLYVPYSRAPEPFVLAA
jgi:hypothetical protein